jgi:hypothetical protein
MNLKRSERKSSRTPVSCGFAIDVWPMAPDAARRPGPHVDKGVVETSEKRTALKIVR